ARRATPTGPANRAAGAPRGCGTHDSLPRTATGTTTAAAQAIAANDLHGSPGGSTPTPTTATRRHDGRTQTASRARRGHRATPPPPAVASAETPPAPPEASALQARRSCHSGPRAPA